jgi:gas vesicle protein
MSKDPEQIRAEIEATRGDLSDNVNALAESVKPGNVARRQVGKVREAAVSTKERIMGAAPDLGSAHDSAASKLDDAKAGIASAASGAGDAVTGSPALVRARTQGNPLAAGVVAFGAGLLLASLIPSSEREQEAAAKVKEAAEPLTEEATALAKESADHLREPAQEAVASVKETATDAVDHTRQEGASAAQQVKGDAQDAAGTVQESRTSSV